MNRVNRFEQIRKYSKVKRNFLVLLCFLLLFSPYMLSLNGLDRYVQAEGEEIIMEEDEVLATEEVEPSETSNEEGETDSVAEIEGQDIEVDEEENNFNEQELKEEELETEINLSSDDIANQDNEGNEETDVETDGNMLQLNDVIQPFANQSDYVTSDSPNGVTITGYNGTETDLIIPSEIDGKMVTIIGERAFEDKNLTSVVLPNTVVTIANYAFQNNQLSSLQIPASVTHIGNNAFAENILTTLQIPNTVQGIGQYAFNKNQLGAVTIGSGLTEIRYGVFAYNNLTEIMIPNNITKIDGQAFMKNDLQTIVLPNTLQEIGGYAFSFNELTKISIPESVGKIGNDAFRVNKIDEVIVKSSTTIFDGDAIFADNQANSTNLMIKSFDPSTAREYAATHGYSFEAMNIFETSNNLDGTLTITSYHGNDKDVTIPSEIDGKIVTIIGQRAFQGKGLTKITLPDTVVTINFEAFQDNQLINLDLPSSVKEIYGRAFADNKLTSLVIPDTVERLVYYTFTNNEIETLQIGSGLTEIGDGIFRDNKLTNVLIPDNITAIRNQAFYINEIETITLPETLQVIEGSAFEDNQLKNISIPSNVNKIFYQAFYNNLLDKVTIHNPTMIFEENDIFKENKTDPTDLIIYGYHLSTAQNHAADNNYTFIAFSTVDSVKTLQDIEVEFGTLAAEIPLPTEVVINLVDGREVNVPVIWEEPLTYDGEKPGVYSITGQLDLPAYISNPSDIIVEVTVIVKEAAEPNKEISARYYDWVPLKTGYYDQKALPLPDKVEVSLNDGTKVELEVVWRAESEPVYDRDTVGEYLFSGEFQLIDGITNPQGHLAQRHFVLTDAIVNVKYVDETGNELATEEILTGKVNDDYTTTEKQINGYTLTETPVNANGKFTVRDIIVNYVYSKELEEIPDKEIIGTFSKGMMKDVGTIELTDIQSLFPETVIVTLDDNTEVELNVTKWDADSEPAFDQEAAGIYVFSGDIDLKDGISNSAGIRAKFSLSLNEIDDPKADKIITAPYYAWTSLKTGHYEQNMLPLPKVVEVSLDDGSKVELEVVWQTDSEPTYDRDLVGDYVFNGEFKLINGVINPNKHIPKYMVRLSSATVTVKYVDESGNELASEEVLTGKVHNEYTTKPKEFNGYTLSEIPTNANGEFTVQDITITYVYIKDLEEIPDKEIITILSVGIKESIGAKDLADVQSLLPEKVTVILEDDREVELNVTKWDADSKPAYDKNTTGTYLFYGDIELPDGIANSAGIRAKFSLSIIDDEASGPASTNIKNIPVIGTAIEIGMKNLPEIHALFPTTVEVELEDGSLIELEVKWSSDSKPSYNKNKEGTYIFTGEIVLKDGITNLNSFEIEYRVNLIDGEKIINPEEGTEEETEEKLNSKDIDKDNDSNGLIVNNETQKPKSSTEEDDFDQERLDRDKILPKTATVYYTFILVGLLLIVLGGIIYTVRKRKQIE